MSADSSVIIRPCFEQDLEQAALIYGHHVLTGTGTFEFEAPSPDEMKERWSKVVGRGWPWIVACPMDDLTRVLGFAYAGQFRDRTAYSLTFEDSVYVAPNAQGQGIGKRLLNDLLVMLQADDVREVIAMIGDNANAASIALHASLGFTHAGILRNAGYKFDRWLDVVIMQRSLRTS
ncbi:MAG: N-acetyltransferase family protein [Caulobacterales bacterium]